MTPRTRTLLDRTRTDLRRFAAEIANPDMCTAKELEDMAHDLAAISIEMFEAAKDIAGDEVAAAEKASEETWKLGGSVMGIVE